MLLSLTMHDWVTDWQLECTNLPCRLTLDHLEFWCSAVSYPTHRPISPTQLATVCLMAACGFQGMFQYFFYTRVLTAMTAPITDKMGHIASAPVKTFIDQALHHPFLYFPCFYGLKYVGVQGETPEVAYQKYREELWPNCQALWTIWVPGQVRRRKDWPSCQALRS